MAFGYFSSAQMSLQSGTAYWFQGPSVTISPAPTVNGKKPERWLDMQVKRRMARKAALACG